VGAEIPQETIVDYVKAFIVGMLYFLAGLLCFTIIAFGIGSLAKSLGLPELREINDSINDFIPHIRILGTFLVIFIITIIVVGLLSYLMYSFNIKL